LKVCQTTWFAQGWFNWGGSAWQTDNPELFF